MSPYRNIIFLFHSILVQLCIFLDDCFIIPINRMLELKIQNPDAFQFASTVTKDSKTGLSSNRRLLVIKGGHLYYYSTVPKSFDGDPSVLDYFHELPKSSLQVTKIKKIVTPSKTSSMLEIYFDSRHLMEREDIRKTLTNESYIFVPKNDKDVDETIWRFTCDNHYIKDKWITILVQLMAHYHQEEKNIAEFFRQSSNKATADIRASVKPTNKTPWRQSTIDRKQYTYDSKGLVQMDDKEEDLDFLKKKEPSSYYEQVRLEDVPMSLQDNPLQLEEGYGGPNMKKGAKPHLAF